MPYFPLASGLLTGKYKTNSTFTSDDIRTLNLDFQGQRFQSIVTDINRLDPITKVHNATIAQVVLAWYLQNPLVSVVIPGAKRPQQAVDNVIALIMNIKKLIKFLMI